MAFLIGSVVDVALRGLEGMSDVVAAVKLDRPVRSQ
jgi:hypothetical protein